MNDNIFFRIVAFFLFPMMLIAMVISLSGFRGPIQMDDTFMSFLRSVFYEAEGYNFHIPNIPKIVPLPSYGMWTEILTFLISIANAFFTVCNWAINFMNLIINIILFIVALIHKLYQFRNVDWSTAGPLTWWY